MRTISSSLDEPHVIQLKNHETLTITGRQLYTLSKEHHKLLDDSIGILPKENTITEISVRLTDYNWRPFQEYIEVWVHYEDSPDSSGGMRFDVPLCIVSGQKTPKECAIMEIEINITDAQDQIISLKAEIAEKRKYITKYKKQLSKIQNI